MTIAIEDAVALVAHAEHLLTGYAGTCATASEVEDVRMTEADELLHTIGPLLQKLMKVAYDMQRDAEKVS